MNVLQAAQRLGVSRRTVYYWLRMGRLEKIGTLGRSTIVRIPPVIDRVCRAKQNLSPVLTEKQMTNTRTIVKWLPTLALLLWASPTFAQSPTALTSVAFIASADHNAVMADGTVVVTRYEMVIDKAATVNPPAAAIPAWATVNLAKPTPDATNTITLTAIAVGLTITSGDYTARIAAVGPGGRSTDLVAPFSQAAVPRAPTGPAKVIR